MSGGYIKSQAARDHQVVLFTFAGAVSTANADAWNAAIKDLKDTFGASITGVTMTGNQSPATTALASAKKRVAAKARKASKPRRRR